MIPATRQFTAGPWGARKLGPPSFTWQVDSNGGPIAVVSTPQKPFATKGDPARSEANAQLIASAPDLYAALIEARRDVIELRHLARDWMTAAQFSESMARVVKWDGVLAAIAPTKGSV